MVHDIIEQQFRAVESIVVNEKISSQEKIRALRQYERFLSQQTGITLQALTEIAHIIHYKSLKKQQIRDELRVIENIFVEGMIKTSTEVGKPLSREECRKIFSDYVNQHFHIKIGRGLKKARLARKKTSKRPVKRPVKKLKRPRVTSSHA